MAEIEALEKRLYQTGRRKGRMPISADLKKEAKKQKINLNNRQEAKDFLAKMKKSLADLPTVSLTLALAPSQALGKRLASWLGEFVAPNAILDITVDKAILGGVLISFRGHYYDFSLKKKLEKKLKTTT